MSIDIKYTEKIGIVLLQLTLIVHNHQTQMFAQNLMLLYSVFKNQPEESKSEDNENV